MGVPFRPISGKLQMENITLEWNNFILLTIYISWNDIYNCSLYTNPCLLTCRCRKKKLPATCYVISHEFYMWPSWALCCVLMQSATNWSLFWCIVGICGLNEGMRIGSGLIFWIVHTSFGAQSSIMRSHVSPCNVILHIEQDIRVQW